MTSLMTTTPTVAGAPGGRVRGRIVNGIHVFRGIPYAAPPFGKGRLLEPEPAPGWFGIRDAIEEGQQPPQLFPPGNPAEGLIPSARAVAGEDCLNLNIWTPDPTARDLPVLVWITGGMFEVGSASWYDGGRFARDGVVCVSINYRVGAEGFLQLEDAPANRGLLDQVAALQWVRENIDAFGGDPDRVTVCGESAGAMAIAVLLAVPRAEGLFRRAICQSGAAHPVLPPAAARRVTLETARRLGVAPTRAAIAALPFSQVLEAQTAVKDDLMADPDPDRWGIEVVATALPFQPVIDGDVLPAEPLARVRAGASHDVDLLLGNNRDDWRIFRVASGELARVTNEVLTGPVATHGYLSARAYGPPDEALAAYRAANPTATPGDLLAAIQTDWWCRIPAIRLADAHADRGGRTYLYEFAWRSPVAGGAFGACHALEIPFVFDTLDQGPAQMLGDLLGPNPPRDLATAMHGAWIRFVRDGDPGWPAYEPPRRETMRFDETSVVVEDPHAWQRRLWGEAASGD